MHPKVLSSTDSSLTEEKEILQFTIKVLALLEAGVSLRHAIQALTEDDSLNDAAPELMAHCKEALDESHVTHVKFLEHFASYKNFSEFYRIMLLTFYAKSEPLEKCFITLLDTVERTRTFL